MAQQRKNDAESNGASGAVRMASSDEHSYMWNKAVSRLLDLFILPEIRKRQEMRRRSKPLALRAAQILFFSDGRRPLVRLNDEIEAVAQIKLKPGIRGKRSGESVFEDEIDGISRVQLVGEDHQDCAHATLIRFRAKWFCAFDFRYNKRLARRNLERATEFYEAAEFSLSRGHLAAFTDTLFSAAELAAKATLLILPGTVKWSHKHVQAHYNRFAKLGNVDQKYRDALNRLAGLRPPARYIENGAVVTNEEASTLLQVVHQMIQWARASTAAT